MLVYACLRACVRVSEILGGGYSCVATGHTVFVSVVSNRHQFDNKIICSSITIIIRPHTEHTHRARVTRFFSVFIRLACYMVSVCRVSGGLVLNYWLSSSGGGGRGGGGA